MVISKYAANQLSEKSECYKLAYDYFCSIPSPANPTKKEDVQPLIEAHYHACMAGEYEHAFNIIFVNNLDEYLDLWGNFTLLIDLYSKLLPEDHFGNQTLLKDKGSHSRILGSLGKAYCALGDAKAISKAIYYHKQALKIAREIGDRRGKSIDLENLGKAYCALGDVKKAIDYYEQALKIAREIGDREEERVWLGNLGNAYSVGDAKKAIYYHKQALKIAREIGDRRGESIDLGNLGLAYYALGEFKKAIYYHEQALKIAQDIGNRRGEGNHLVKLGLAYSDLGESKKATEYYEKGLSIGKEIKNRIIINYCEICLEVLKGSEK